MVHKTLEEQRSELEKQKAQIEARLKAINAKETDAKRKLDTRRKVIVGALVLGAAEAAGPHRDWLLQVLRAATTRPQEKKIIAGLIRDLEARDNPSTLPTA